MESADFLNGSYISIPASVCKSIPGTEDKDGNYTFEVEASNENLDLQNQKILQSALLNSKEYFLTNGVVSDDHQHKVRKDDGTVETNKDKIIGEPVSVRTDGKKTFVKGILYGAVEAAKPFINLLKAHSSRVKASVGGIMPQVRKNADGSETVTGFMWNDLALTCSHKNTENGVGCVILLPKLWKISFLACKKIADLLSYQSSNEEVADKLFDFQKGCLQPLFFV